MSKKQTMPSVDQKKPKSFKSLADFYMSGDAIPSRIKAFLNEKGLSYRLINAVKYKGSGNFHRSHWVPLEIPKEMRPDLASVDGVGLSPEGYLVKGDLVLATRSKEMNSTHRRLLDEQAMRLKGYNKIKGQELQEYANEHGLGAKVEVGYGDEGSSEE